MFPQECREGWLAIFYDYIFPSLLEIIVAAFDYKED
jgi:hypothetical protein